MVQNYNAKYEAKSIKAKKKKSLMRVYEAPSDRQYAREMPSTEVLKQSLRQQDQLKRSKIIT